MLLLEELNYKDKYTYIPSILRRLRYKQAGWKSAFFLLSVLLYCFVFPCLASESLIIEPDQGREPILRAIQEAQSALDLVIYGFTDPELIQAFIQAKEKGKKLRILLQHFPYKNLDENQLAIQRFSAKQVNLAFAPTTFYLLHQKTLLIDQRLALVLTFNFTRSAFKKERNFGLIIKDPTQVQEIQRAFNSDWQNKSTHLNDPHLFWSPDNSREKILDLINSAKKELKVYAQGLSDHQVIAALASAAGRGVQVQILTSGTPPGKKWAYLERAGVQFALDKHLLIHAKVLMVDRTIALLGSINFTQTSMDKNRELSVLVNDPKIMQDLLRVFEHDWRDAQT